MTTILLVDLSSVCYPLWHKTQGSTNPNECSIQTVAKVRALASGQAHCAICCDSGRSFRRDIDPTYKAQRPESDATLQHQIALARETLVADGFPVWAVKGFEADDLLASATNWICAHTAWDPTSDPDVLANRAATIEISDAHVLIASSDKDLLQLISDRVTVHRLTDGSQWDAAKVQEKLGIAPNQMRDYLSLVGDASDNIKGAKGIGAKTAAALLTRYGNLEDLYAALDQHGTQFTPATATSLREFQSRMATVRSLVTLRTDVPLPFEEVFRERVPVDVATFGEDDNMAESEAPAGVAISGIDTPVANAAPVFEPSVPNGGDSGRSPVDPMQAMREEAIKTAVPPTTAASVASSPQSKPTATADPFADMMSKPASINGYERELEPRNLRDASLLSIEIHKSRLYSAYGTWQGVLTTILAGRELGMQAMASLRAFHIIDGKPTMSADLIRALVLKSGHAEYFRCTERTPTHATFVTKRKGEPEISLTFTIEEGRKAWPKDQSAFEKSGWGKNPADMCVARAGAKLARLVYADVVFNMYAPEEMEN